MAESSSTASKIDKPVIVRVKRKAFQSPLDAFWLEINERPIKRPLLDFGKLSISDSSSSRVEELKTKKILVRHVETVTSSENTYDVLRTFMPNSSNGLKPKDTNEGRRNVKTATKQDQLLVKAKQKQEVLSRNARFEQIWRSRKGKEEASEDEAVYEMCRLYDVVRVDVDEQEEVKVQKEMNKDLEEYRMMAQYLPLLEEILPTAATEIEDGICHHMSKRASSDGYVYDVYAVNEEASAMEADSTTLFPLVQVDDDDDFYDGPDDSDYETDDSNAENNPLNDYPDEEISEDDDEVSSRSSDEKSEDASSKTSHNSSEDMEVGGRLFFDNEYSEPRDWSHNADHVFDDELYGDENEDDFGDEEWRYS